MNIISYLRVGGVPFGADRKSVAEEYGPPLREGKCYQGGLKLSYIDKVVVFDPLTERFRECTFVFGADLCINEQKIEWTNEQFRRMCQQDGDPRAGGGVVVLLRFGISIMDPRSHEESEQSLTAFSEGAFDHLLDKMEPYLTA